MASNCLDMKAPREMSITPSSHRRVRLRRRRKTTVSEFYPVRKNRQTSVARSRSTMDVSNRARFPRAVRAQNCVAASADAEFATPEARWPGHRTEECPYRADAALLQILFCCRVAIRFCEARATNPSARVKFPLRRHSSKTMADPNNRPAPFRRTKKSFSRAQPLRQGLQWRNANSRRDLQDSTQERDKRFLAALIGTPI